MHFYIKMETMLVTLPNFKPSKLFFFPTGDDRTCIFVSMMILCPFKLVQRDYVCILISIQVHVKW